MSEYRIFETRQFDEDLRAIARVGHGDVVRKLREIVYPEPRSRPHFGPHVRMLKDYSPDTWRYRIGAWRFFYEIDDEKGIIFMIAASHRGSEY